MEVARKLPGNLAQPFQGVGTAKLADEEVVRPSGQVVDEARKGLRISPVEWRVEPRAHDEHGVEAERGRRQDDTRKDRAPGHAAAGGKKDKAGQADIDDGEVMSKAEGKEIGREQQGAKVTRSLLVDR